MKSDTHLADDACPYCGSNGDCKHFLANFDLTFPGEGDIGAGLGGGELYNSKNASRLIDEGGYIAVEMHLVANDKTLENRLVDPTFNWLTASPSLKTFCEDLVDAVPAALEDSSIEEVPDWINAYKDYYSDDVRQCISGLLSEINNDYQITESYCDGVGTSSAYESWWTDDAKETVQKLDKHIDDILALDKNDFYHLINDEPDDSDSQAPSTIIHIPHSSRIIPRELRDRILLTDNELEAELDRLTDHYTDELFSIEDQNTEILKYYVSRYIVDPERFPDDDLEPMSKHGQGVIYTKTVDGKTLREKLSPTDRKQQLDFNYWPHHSSLENLTTNALKKHGHALIIDCHSFPSSPLPIDLDQSPDRPDICIGTDEYHTPTELVQFLQDKFVEAGYSVAINKPYAGTMVPTRYYKKDDRVKSVMIEINRRLYLTDEPADISKKEPEFTQLQAFLDSTIRKLVIFF